MLNLRNPVISIKRSETALGTTHLSLWFHRLEGTVVTLAMQILSGTPQPLENASLTAVALLLNKLARRTPLSCTSRRIARKYSQDRV